MTPPPLRSGPTLPRDRTPAPRPSIGRPAVFAIAAISLAASPLGAAPADQLPAPSPPASSTGEAWFTGPMLANSPATPAAGHLVGETFFFVPMSRGVRTYGSLTYLLYGVTDRFAIGVKPLFKVNRVDGRTSAPGPGDMMLSAQYRLTPPSVVGRPDVALNLLIGVPLGRHDRLGAHPEIAMGSGAPSATVSLYAQQSLRLANGRLVRARLNIGHSFNGAAKVSGTSVYGTQDGERGRAHPGNSTLVVVAGEYSLTRHWAVAMDAIYEHGGAGTLSDLKGSDGTPVPGGASRRLPPSASFALAPAIEYNVTADLGLLVGARVRFRGRNTPASIMPAIALTFALKP